VFDAEQERLVGDAQWVCLTVGPAAAAAQTLAIARPEAQMAWAVKADPRAVAPQLAARIVARADVIAWNRGEASFLADALSACGAPQRRRLLVETRGGDGVALHVEGLERIIRVEPFAVEDGTGAGDTFLGGLLAALMACPDRPGEAVEAGVRAARAMLVARGCEKRGNGGNDP